MTVHRPRLNRKPRKTIRFLFTVLLLGGPLFAQDEAAQSAETQQAAPPIEEIAEIQAAAPDAPELGSRAAMVLDAVTGTVLYSKNPDKEISPASLTKLMTIHIALTEVAAGNASLDEVVPLPRQSWGSSQPPRSSLMGLAAGQKVTLGELLLGLAVSSGNDAAVAVALRFAPSVAEFADLMNREAKKFGLTQTHFVEPSGISEYNITTVREFTWFCKEYIRLHPGTLT